MNTSNFEYIMNDAGLIGAIGGFFVLCAALLVLSAVKEGGAWLLHKLFK